MPSTLTRFVAIATLVLFPSISIAAEPTIEITTDRPDAIYQPGDAVTFRILLKDAGGKPVIGQTMMFRITKDGGPKMADGPLETEAQPVEIIGSLTEPGFLRCDVTYKPEGGDRTISGTGAAGFEPEKIPPSMPPPDDFDAFWAKQKELLKSEAMKPVLTPVDSKDDAVEAFDVQINCPGGAPVSGYLARPKGAKEKLLPAILYPHSAGVRNSDLPHAIKGAKMGLIAFDFNAHGMPNGKGEEFYKEKLNGDLKGYAGRGIEDRETIYFRGMILRLLRAVDFLTTLPEWDGKTLIVYGSSQGGGQALVAGGLDPRVTLCLANVPALCDHTGFAAERASGWPKLVPRVSGKYDEKATQAARYVDAMNFARTIQCPTVVTVGFADKTCPPSSVYAAYNVIPSKAKRIIVRPLMGHAFPPDLIEAFDEEVRKHAAQQRASR